MSAPPVLPTIPQYRVSIWEGIAIAAGAVLIVAVGLAGLGVKALNNAFDPQRAEAIAQSMADFAIPGGSRGLFGTNVGGGRMAVMGSDAALQLSAPTGSTMPQVELLIARIPIQPDTEADDTDNWGTELFFSGFSFSNQTEGAFQVATTRTEQIAFCGAIAPVKIEEGRLATSEQTSVPAIRYETKASFENEDHIAIVAAVGQSAAEKAAQVFESIRCR